MVWGCLLLFGPCFFIAGICTYPMAMARRIANEAYNATVDYESLGAVCTVRSYQHCWRTRTSFPCSNCETTYYCDDYYNYTFDAPSATNLDSVSESVNRISGCHYRAKCGCQEGSYDVQSGCSERSSGGFSNRSFRVEQVVNCWKLLPVAANSTVDYACGNPPCIKLWDPAIEVDDAGLRAEIVEWTTFTLLILGILGWVAWGFQCVEWYFEKNNKGIKGNAREASRRQLTRARSARATCCSFFRKRDAGDVATSGIVLQATVATATDAGTVVVAAELLDPMDKLPNDEPGAWAGRLAAMPTVGCHGPNWPSVEELAVRFMAREGHPGTIGDFGWRPDPDAAPRGYETPGQRELRRERRYESLIRAMRELYAAMTVHRAPYDLDAVRRVFGSKIPSVQLVRMLDAGFSLEQAHEAGVPLRGFLERGYEYGPCAKIGFTALEMRQAGTYGGLKAYAEFYSVAELLSSGVTQSELDMLKAGA